MKQKDKITISQQEMNSKLIHSPSPMHVQAFLKGGQVHKNKKAYTRKEKHKKDYY